MEHSQVEPIPDDLKELYAFTTSQLVRRIPGVQPDATSKSWRELCHKPMKTLIKRIARAEQRNRELEADVLRRENEEAAVCPEDVGFAEYIRSLEQQLAALKVRHEELEKMAKGWLLWIDRKEVACPPTLYQDTEAALARAHSVAAEEENRGKVGPLTS